MYQQTQCSPIQGTEHAASQGKTPTTDKTSYKGRPPNILINNKDKTELKEQKKGVDKK